MTQDINRMDDGELRMQAIARRFSKARSTYEDHASVQHELGQALFERILAVRRNFSKILDIGCGTGAFSARLLSLNPRTLVLNDISEEMIGHCRKRFMGHDNVAFRMLDAERRTLGEGYDLIASNAAVQWFVDLKQGLLNFRRSLEKGGLIAFGTFVKGNLEEIREIGGWGLSYLSADELADSVSSVFPHSKIVPMTFSTHHPDVIAMLRSLRASGVTGMSGGSWTSCRLKKFVSDYGERFGDAEGVRLTWQAATVLASVDSEL